VVSEKVIILNHMKLACVLIIKGLAKLYDMNQLYATFRMMCNMLEYVFKSIS